jgi:hypothetical protein
MPIAYCVWKIENSSCDLSETTKEMKKKKEKKIGRSPISLVRSCRRARTRSRVRCDSSCANTCSRSSARTSPTSRSRRSAPISTTCLRALEPHADIDRSIDRPIARQSVRTSQLPPKKHEKKRRKKVLVRTDCTKAQDSKASLQRSCATRHETPKLFVKVFFFFFFF